MKEIIKLAIKNYITALVVLMLFVSTVAIIHTGIVLLVLWYAFLIFIVGEVIVFVLNKIIKYITNNKK